jgi:hypothetical protein
VLADRDVVEMKEDVDSHIPERHNTDIIFRRGDPCDLGSIRLVRPEYARSAILFAEEKQRGDAVVLKRLLAARRSDVHRKSPLRIVAEVDNRQNSEAILGMNAGACVVDSSSFVTSILLQAAREPGLGLVYEEFTDFDGWEIYFDDLDSIASPPASQTYGDAVLDPHRPCSVFGIAPKNGPHILNPPAEHLLAEGDRLVVLAEDGAESRRSLSPPIATRTTENKPEQAIVNQDQVPPREPMHCIILGWHRWASALLEEFDAALPQGSTVHIVCDASLTAHRGGPPLSLLNSLNNLRITTEEADTCERTTIENLGSNLSRADRIILLCYRDTLSSQEADSCTLLTLLHVRNQLQGSNSHHPIIAELLDAKTRELAQSDHDNDFIASDRIISSVMTQFSENPELPPILEELLTTNGSEVHLRPRSAFFRDATNAPFKAVIREGLSRCETVIGVLRFRSGSQPAVDWNIHDSNFMALGENDKVIVIAED